MLFEPGKEQSIAICLTPVTIITHIEQYIKVLFKKFIENGKDGLFYFWVMGRSTIVHFPYDKLIGIASPNRHFFFKRYRITNSKFCFKPEFSIRGQSDVIASSNIYLL